MKVKRLTLIVLPVVLALGLVACGGTAAPSGPSAGASTLVIAIDTSDMIMLDPCQAYEETTMLTTAAAYEGLVDFDPGDVTKAVVGLADKWDISSDGLTYTYHLNPNAKFSSGNPVTAEDVRFSLMRLKNLKGNPSFWMDPVKEVQVVDTKTVKVILTAASPSWLAISAAPAIMDSKVVKEHGGTDAADADKTDTAKAWLDQNSAGSGAYTIKSWTPKVEVVMEANPNYYRGKSKLSRIILKHVTDPTTALQMLQKGDADMVYSVNYDLVDQAKADPNLNVVVGQTLNQNYLVMTSNPDISKPLSNKLVRQAIVLSVDYDGLIKAILRGYGSRAPTVLPLGILGVDPKATQGRDVKRAKELLKQAGYPDGFTVDLSYGSNPVRETIGAKIKSDLAEVGITVNLKPAEETVYLADMRAQKLAFCFGGWLPDYMDPCTWTDYFTYHDQGISKRMWYNNPEAEKLARVIATQIDVTKREQAIKDLQKIWLDDAWSTMLYQQQQITAMNKSVKGFVYDPSHWTQPENLSK